MSTEPQEDADPYPSMGTSIRVGFSDGERSWNESVDVVELPGEVLEAAGVEYSLDGISFQLADGWIVEPDIRGLQPVHQGGVNITSVVIARHPHIAPGGLFEYQHAHGDNLDAAFRAGFKNWLELDYAVLADALREQPQFCTLLKYSEPDFGEVRILLGPAIGFARRAALSSPSDDPHPFCPCCLFTNSFEVFRQLFQVDGLVGLRLYCLRDDQGDISADCRVNGYDWSPGKAALEHYTRTWPDRGFEFRKQYVLVQRLTGEPAGEPG